MNNDVLQLRLLFVAVALNIINSDFLYMPYDPNNQDYQKKGDKI